MKKLFTSTATAVGGREGRVTAESGSFDLGLAMPMPGADTAGKSNPEELFAAGYAACFDSAMNIVAMQKGIKHDGSEIKADVSLNKGDAGYALSVEMDVLIKGVDEETARQLVEEGHQVCPYSNATRGNIDVSFNVRTA
ncbi:OsmC family protein [Jeotgalibacillus alimentarius]|uniref:OsmC family protein n=3 Tax=Jeotgalibacillus TaxID=157226 RepID=A0A0C2VFI2_9BACL|nr:MULTISPECIES: organic hydroperoxide resistance protein [Jeotgalibacillus]AJD92903.1 OsmC family protein [Jeotgalibacillus malaysiensis]KIL42778.1 OsmC family protein [Jeotgalibacillus alimentarius]MBM7579720.1 Ohr subfamily peroxiredoxin [Jeotgalibacillus terrae]